MSSSYTHDERPAERGVDRTFVVNGNGRSGGSGWFIAGILVVALVVGAFFLFGGNLLGARGGSAGGGSTQVTIDTPDINVGTPAAPVGGTAPASSSPAN